jgi:hypothetical protein
MNMEDETTTIAPEAAVVKKGRGRPKGHTKCKICKEWKDEGKEHTCVKIEKE